MAKFNLVQREKWLLPSFIALFFLSLTSGSYIWLFDGSGYSAQFSALLHTLVASFWAILFLAYLFIHFKRTIGSRRLGLNTSGLILSTAGIAIIATGVYLIIEGFEESYSKNHLYSTIILLLVFSLHILHSRRSVKDNAKAKANLPLIQNKTFLLSALSCMFLLSVIAIPNYFYEGKKLALFTKVENYQLNYGKNPFSPSKTTTKNQSFIADHAVSDSINCQQCHGDIYQQWQSSIHRYAAADPSYVRNVTLLEGKKGIAATRYCEGCHAPSALLTGALTPGGKHGGTAGTTAFNEGVSCKSCHSISSINSTEGVASYHFDPKAEYLFDGLDNIIGQSINNFILETLPQDHKKAFAPAEIKTAKFCATCHAQFMDESMNNWGWVKMQDEYSAWLNSPYSGKHDDTYSQKDVTRCQDCHMPLIDANDPAANAEGKVRSHRFLGANTYVAQHFNEKKQLDQTIDFLQQNKMRISIDEPRRKVNTESRLTVEQALKLHSETPYFAYLGETIPLNVLITNIGVGHDFPGGAIDLNEAWLHLEILDAQNRQVFISGELLADKTVDPQAIFYKATAINRHGREVWRHDLFNMTGESYRNVIKAGQTDRVEYQLTIPAWAKSPITAYATLKYRKLNRRYSDWVANGKEYRDIPIIDVARSSLSIPVLKEPPVY